MSYVHVFILCYILFLLQAKVLSKAKQVETRSILNITSALTLATDLDTNKQMFAGDLNVATNTLETISGLVAKLDKGDRVSDIAEVQVFSFNI